MNRYLLKIHPIDNFVGGFGHSRNPSDWEGGVLISPALGRVYPNEGKPKVKPPQIQPGDELWIWTHEKKGGKGLIAKATTANIATGEDDTRITLENVELVPHPFDFSVFPKKEKSKRRKIGCRVLDYILAYTHSKVHWIEDDDYDEFARLAQEYGWGSNVIDARNAELVDDMESGLSDG